MFLRLVEAVDGVQPKYRSVKCQILAQGYTMTTRRGEISERSEQTGMCSLVSAP